MNLPLVTGTNNANRQVSVDAWNNLINKVNEVAGIWPSINDVEGIDPIGLTDSAAGLAELFTTYARVYIPEGDYLIARAGANTHGVDVEWVQSIEVVCHPLARFFTDDVDGNLINFAPPSDGAGLPDTKLTFKWTGGRFDQSSQRSSTFIPYPDDYPPAKSGTAVQCDGLSVRGVYTVGATRYSAASLVEIEDVVFYSGDHWQSAGGDGQFYSAEGVDHTIVRACTFIGARDGGIYFSRDGNGQAGETAIAEGCRFVNCFYGSTGKRGLTKFVTRDCTFENCVQATVSNYVSPAPDEVESITVEGNRYLKCTTAIRLDYSLGATVSGNDIVLTGAELEDGTAFPNSVVVPAAMKLSGTTYTTVSGNKIRGLNPLFAALQVSPCLLQDHSDTGTPTTHTIYHGNVVQGLRAAFTELGAANDNIYYNNTSISTTLTNGTTVGSRSCVLNPYDTGTSGSRRFIGGTEIWQDSIAGFRFKVPFGYVTGAGGSVTQATSKTTTVALNKPSGRITMHNAALAAGASAKFFVNNSEVASTDSISLVLQGGAADGANYSYRVTSVSSGNFSITVKNESGGSLSEALVLTFNVIKGANS